MKPMLFVAVIILLTANLYAQSGMPRELTCTERAFNFSFSLGANWKVGAPKMGPAEVTREEPDFMPAAWCLKHNYATSETELLPTVKKTLNVEKQPSLFNYNTLSLKDKPKHLIPGINLSPAIYYHPILVSSSAIR